MDPTSNLHQDSILHGVIKDINTETPRQDPQKTCTRNSPCLQQGCLICSTPTNHVRNLDVSPTNHVRNLKVSLNNFNGPPNSTTSLTSPTADECPPPPINHPISSLTTALQRAIRQKNIVELKLLLKFHDDILHSSLDFIIYDRTALQTAQLTATQSSIPTPPPPHPSLPRHPTD